MQRNRRRIAPVGNWTGLRGHSRRNGVARRLFVVLALGGFLGALAGASGPDARQKGAAARQDGVDAISAPMISGRSAA